MKKMFYAFLMVGLIGLFVIGCSKFTGGGWISSSIGEDAKATFGFNMQITDKDEDGNFEIKGQVQYNDHGAGIMFHGTVTDGYVCAEDGGYMGYIEGYTKDGCKFSMILLDGGKPGSLDEGVDSMAVCIPDLCYFNYGSLGGGNLQCHPEKK